MKFKDEGYYIPSEPPKEQRRVNWANAIGLQKVDGLTPSAYLLGLAEDNINGKLSIEEVNQNLKDYYSQKSVREAEAGTRQEEADIVSARIADILGIQASFFSYASLLTIHKILFTGIYSHAGTVRTYNLSKREWVLNGDTVIYGNYFQLKSDVCEILDIERDWKLTPDNRDNFVKHIASFIASLWKVHPFGEGNTRTTAVFLIKYLNTYGFNVSNDSFKENSWYFRNALVRASYSNLVYGILETTEYLEKFLSNLLFNTSYELHNRDLRIPSQEGDNK